MPGVDPQKVDAAKALRDGLATTDYKNMPISSCATHRADLQKAIGKISPKPGGDTGLYDTALAAYRAVQKGWQAGVSNSVVIYTDGKNDNPGGLTIDQLVDKMTKLRDPKRPPTPATATPLAVAGSAITGAGGTLAVASSGIASASFGTNKIGYTISGIAGSGAGTATSGLSGNYAGYTTGGETVGSAAKPTPGRRRHGGHHQTA